MTVTLSTAVRNAELAAFVTELGASPILRIRTGAPPANVASASTGTVLASCNLPSSPFTTPSGGAISKSGTWEDTSADNGGEARHFEFVKSDGTTVVARGLASRQWTSSTAYLVGQQVVNNGLAYVVTTAGTSAGSGGPTGTGTGITDGTVVWNYVGPNDMVLDSTTFTAGQAFSVTAFSRTRSGA